MVRISQESIDEQYMYLKVLGFKDRDEYKMVHAAISDLLRRMGNDI